MFRFVQSTVNMPSQWFELRLAWFQATKSDEPWQSFPLEQQTVLAEFASLDDPIVTDRPDFTEASSVVGLGVVQLEVGYTYTFDDEGPGSTKANSYPEPLLRYGIFRDWLELRVGWNYI